MEISLKTFSVILVVVYIYMYEHLIKLNQSINDLHDNPGTTPMLLFLAFPVVVVQVWQGWQDKYTPCIQWHVDLSQLTYLGEKVCSRLNLYQKQSFLNFTNLVKFF